MPTNYFIFFIQCLGFFIPKNTKHKEKKKKKKTLKLLQKPKTHHKVIVATKKTHSFKHYEGKQSKSTSSWSQVSFHAETVTPRFEVLGHQ